MGSICREDGMVANACNLLQILSVLTKCSRELK